MTDGDDIAETLLEGDPYEQAVLNVRRVFPLSLRRKIQTAILTLAASVLFGPALAVRRDAIEAFERTTTLQLAISTMAFFGVIVTFAFGVLLVRQQRILQKRSLTEQDARRLVRIEDMIMFFAVQGMAFILIPTVLSVVGVVSPGTIGTLYAYGVAVYTPAGAVSVDARLVSALGVVLSGGLFALWWIVRRGDPAP